MFQSFTRAMQLIVLVFFFSEFPDPLDLATGIEKKEMLLRLAGNDVSFFSHDNMLYFRF